MSKQTPRHWVGFLDDEINGGLVLYDRKSRDRSPHDVYLYHFKTDEIINHFKYTVKEHFRPLDEYEMRQVKKVKAAYLAWKLEYFRHYRKFQESRYAYQIPSEFIYLSHTMGGGRGSRFGGVLIGNLSVRNKLTPEFTVFRLLNKKVVPAEEGSPEYQYHLYMRLIWHVSPFM